MINDLESKREKYAAASGYTYVGKVGDDTTLAKHVRCDYGIYRRLSCNHERVFNHQNIRQGIKECKQCRHEEHITYAESLGMTFVKFSRPNNKGTLYIDVIMACGHYKSIQTGNLYVKGWRCEECFLKQTNEATEPFGITMLKSLGETNWECILPCGCTSTLRINNAKRGAWSCKEHKTNYVYWASKLYLIRIDTIGSSWLKLGVSANPENRGSKYGITAHHTFEVLKEVDFETGTSAVNAEKKLHKKYRKMRLDPVCMKDIMLWSGHTECYSVDMLSTLSEELDELNKRK